MIFFFFVLGKPLKYFPFYSPILLTLWFRSLQTCVKESCMYLSSQLCKTPNKNLKFQEKSKKNAFYNNLQTYIPKIFPLLSIIRPSPRSHWTKQTAKKPNLWGETAVDKSAWIKAWRLSIFAVYWTLKSAWNNPWASYIM